MLWWWKNDSFDMVGDGIADTRGVAKRQGRCPARHQSNHQ
jgi:hypothetical protein